MGIGARVISAVLKSVVGDKVGTGLIKELADISIGEVSEKSMSKINDFINREKNKIENILSKENMKSMNIPEENADYVVAEVKDLLSGINIADEVLRQCKYDCKKLSDFLWIEYCKDKGGYIECKNDIKRTLLAVAEALIKLMYESESFQNKFLVQISNSVDNIDLDIHNISNYMKKNFNKLDVDNQNILNILLTILEQTKNYNAPDRGIEAKIQSRTQEYADKWNENMFLNDFDEWDENAGVNVKLSDVYLEEHLPHFVWGNNITVSTNLHTFLSRYIVEKNGNEMLLVFGQPGIGKSTLITWITANFADQIDNILVYRFASDLKTVDWWDDNVSRAILGTLRLSYDDLSGKTLVLDGFDEINIGKDRKEVLDKIYWDVVKKIKNFSLIITCRENYVDKFERVACKYIILKPWDENQIISFCRIFQEKTKNNLYESTKKKLLENKEILGIPLILYMVLALNISVEKGGSIVDVYDKIFALEGGIYDRCIDNKSFADKHRISEIKEQIHQISRDIAIWMFENNLGRENISQEEYLKICEAVIEKDVPEKEIIKNDFLIGNYFRLVRHCEGTETEELHFVHRTIYEYFVAETIYSSIENGVKQLSIASQEEVAGNISIYLKQGVIIGEIGNYLKYKILKLYNKLDKKKQDFFYKWWEKLIENMMNAGMFYHTNKDRYYCNVLNKETQCFVNLIEILRLLSDVNRNTYIFEDNDHVLLMRYIKHSLVESKIIYIDDMEIDDIGSVCERYVLDLSELALEKAYLERCDLSMVDLSRTNLRYSTLRLANLRGANLQWANLEGAELGGADLRDAQLQFAHLVSANLSRAILIGANLIRADLRKADLTDANLTDVELEQSEWYLSDVKKIFPQLKSTIFTYIIVADCKKKKLYKNELFPDIYSPSDSGSSLFLELRKSLEKSAIDLLDFCMMDDDEKKEVLQEAGLDSDDFDFNFNE